MSVYRFIPINNANNTLRAEKKYFPNCPLNIRCKCRNLFKKIRFHCSMRISLNYSTICTANPIVGKSHEAKKGEYPFVVSLSRSRNIIDIENHFCGGTLISKRLVLTAEHCIRNWDKEDVVVIVKTLDFSSGQIYEIKSWLTYEEWATSQLSPLDIESKSSSYYEMMGASDIEDDSHKMTISQNDIAIIILSSNVENVEPAKLTALHDYELIGAEAVTVGWGSVGNTSNIAPGTLLEVSLKVLSASEIQENFYQMFNILGFVDPHYFYTSADPPAVLGCGDSGGPLMLRSSKRLIAVNKGSCHMKNPRSDRYSMSRHVKLLDKYRKFIKDMENINLH